MRVAVFSAQPYDRQFLSREFSGSRHELVFLEPRLSMETHRLAEGFSALCAFVNDELSRPVLEAVAALGVRLIALRCAGFNNVDLEAAAACQVKVVRVPAYSPHAVAEHTVGMILCLNRKLHRAYHRIRDGNFALDGLLGFDLNGKTAGIIGTGRIGALVAKILHGFGCRVLLHDSFPQPACLAWGEYVPLELLCAECDILTLHCPLVPATFHLIREATLNLMRPGVMVVNTSRGALVDTAAVINGLKSGRIGSLALDVYEEEADLFFQDLSNRVIQDDQFSRLLTFPNVLITGHQAFFTEQALTQIAQTTLSSLDAFELGGALVNEVPLPAAP